MWTTLQPYCMWLLNMLELTLKNHTSIYQDTKLYRVLNKNKHYQQLCKKQDKNVCFTLVYTLFFLVLKKATHSHFITLHSSNFGVLSWLRSQFQGWWTNSQKARAARRLSTVMFHSWVKQHHLQISSMAPEWVFFLLTIHYTHYPKPTCL